MAPHAKLSASNTKRWWTCPGSQAWIEAYVDGSPSGFAANQGTCAHALVEKCLEEGKDPIDFEGRVIRIINPETDKEGTSFLKSGASLKDKYDFEVDGDMIDATSVMVAYVRQRVQETGAELHLESYTIPLPDRDDSGGTADTTLDAWPDVLEIVDYKHGAGVYVPVSNNPQTRSYLLGKAIETGFSHDLYRHTIIQPRCREAPDIATEEMTRAELLEFAAGLKAAALRVDKARAFVTKKATLTDLYEAGMLSTGTDGSGCTFCPLMRADKSNRVLCPAAQARIEELAQADFDDEPEALPLPDGSDLERISHLLSWVPFIDKFVKGLKDGALQLALAGENIPGSKLVRGKANRQWRDTRKVLDPETGEERLELITPEEIIEEVVMDFGLDPKDLLTIPTLKSGPQVEKLIRDKGQKSEFDQRFLFKPRGKLSLVPEGDPRPAVEHPTSDLSDFDSWDEEPEA